MTDSLFTERNLFIFLQATGLGLLASNLAFELLASIPDRTNIFYKPGRVRKYQLVLTSSSNIHFFLLLSKKYFKLFWKTEFIRTQPANVKSQPRTETIKVNSNPTRSEKKNSLIQPNLKKSIYPTRCRALFEGREYYERKRKKIAWKLKLKRQNKRSSEQDKTVADSTPQSGTRRQKYPKVSFVLKRHF